MIKERRFPRIFYGWWIVLTGCFLNLWGAGYYIYGFSALFKPLAGELGFSRAVTSVAGSIGRVGGGLEAPVTGWLTDRFGPKWVILFGVSLFAVGLILMNFIDSLWAFYLVWGVLVATGFNVGAMLPIDKAITNWFVKKRGMALGIRWVFSGVLILPLITWLITTQGWRTASVVGGVVMGVVGLLLTWFLVKEHRPEHYGLLPDGATAEAESSETGGMIDRGADYAAEFEEVEFTLRQALRTPAYWLLMLAQAAHGVTIMSLFIHLMPLVTDLGISATKAATTVTIAGLFSIVARFATGFVADRVSKESLRFLMGGAYLLQGVGLAIFLLNPTAVMVFPFLIVYYIGMGASIILMSIIGGRYFGRKAFGSIRGSSAIATMPLGVVGPIYAGWVYDTTGSYVVALTVFAAVLGLAAVLMFLARPPKPPLKVSDIGTIL